jgi:EAL domain-containing protein (putative c-di-GMP-specific phosphodiesterase class I)
LLRIYEMNIHELDDMAGNSVFSNLRTEEDGSWTAVYGAFTLHSALQPIFSQDDEGYLEIQAFEGLIRPSRNGEWVRPAEFFPLVAREDSAMIDSLCRTLHIFNTGALRRTNAKLFVNFHPGLFVTDADIRREVELIKLAAREAGMSPDRIVCEITQKQNDTADMLAHFVAELRQHGFRIAIDEYGADERDSLRLKLMKPDYVKFEADWVKEFLENSAGSALLRVMVNQFKEQGILTIFEGLEDLRQVDLSRNLHVPLVQGYALARPQIAPTTFNEEFPESAAPTPASLKSGADLERYNPDVHLPKAATVSYNPVARRTTAFGKRTR